MRVRPGGMMYSGNLPGRSYRRLGRRTDGPDGKGMAALTDNILNTTNDVQTVTYTFTPHIRPGDGGAE